MRRSWLVPALSLALAACGRLTTEHVVTGVDRGASGGPVGIVMENEPPPAQFDEVALVRAFGAGTCGMGTARRSPTRVARVLNTRKWRKPFADQPSALPA